MDKLEMMKTFVVVARHGSFTLAANELDISVQTVSKYIKALESHLDVRLFNRTTRNVHLSHTGTAYFERCVDLLGQFDELEASLSSEHHAPAGRVRISAPTAFGELHLVPVLAKFQQQYPKISIDIDLSNRRVSLVDEGFDLAIRIGQPSDSSMIAKKLTDMRVTVCAAPSYLQQHGTPSHPKELANHNCLIDTNFRFAKHWPFNVGGKEFKVEVAGNFQANSPGSIKKMVAAGLGIGICPYYVLNEEIIAGTLVPLFEKHEALNFGVYAMYPYRKHLSNRVRLLVEFLATQFRLMQ